MGKDLLGRTLQSEAGLVHHHELIRNTGNILHTVRDKHDGAARGGLIIQNVAQNALSPLRVKARRGLVKYKHVRAHGDHACDGHAALLSAGQLERRALKNVLRYAGEAGGLTHTSRDLFLGEAHIFGAEGNIPEHRLFKKLIFGVLEHQAHPKTRSPQQRLAAVDILAIQQNAALRRLQQSVQMLDESPLELSGGQKRRVAIAGVIAMMPRVLILDEPTAGLDPAGRESILANILHYRQETGCTILLISHSMDDVARFAERLIVFDGGRVAMDGTPAQIFDRAEALKAMGLTVPAATEIALALRARGVDIPESIYTINYLKKLLVSPGEEDGSC